MRLKKLLLCQSRVVAGGKLRLASMLSQSGKVLVHCFATTWIPAFAGMTVLCMSLPAQAETSDCQITKRRIEAAVSAATSCKSNTDCSITYLPCGFGCNVALNGSQNSVSGIMGTFERNCDLSCTKTECEDTPDDLRVECREGRCATYRESEREEPQGYQPPTHQPVTREDEKRAQQLKRKQEQEAVQADFDKLRKAQQEQAEKRTAPVREEPKKSASGAVIIY